ncbi:hypothetical protein N7470_003468 [Penicillium chermesinum]|nr:hypothetical protein N7470_003468 [Penicillium chermesinum]
MVRPRGRSNLGVDIRGDTSAPAMSTMNDVSPVEPTSPDMHKQLDSAVSEKSSKPHAKKRRARSLLHRFADTCLKYTWLLPLLITVFLLSLYAINPTTSNPMHSAIFLSYPQPPKYPGGPVMYGKGKKDIAFVAFYTVVLSFTREFIMQQMIRPLAAYAGIKGKGKTARFMEQVYTALYFGVFGPFGLYVMKRSDIWYFNTTAMFEGFPHREHEALFKAYYLLEASYWAQQAIVLLLQLEKPRKDFKELVGHHIITLCIDWPELSFPFHVYGSRCTSKTLNYLDHWITVPYFGMFVGMWIYLRHVLNLKILWAVLTEFRTVGPFELNWETQQYKCWISQYITFALLASLQAVNLFWLFLILRILANYIFNSDERSDDESEEEEVENAAESKAALVTGVESSEQENQVPPVLVNGEPAPELHNLRSRSGKA